MNNEICADFAEEKKDKFGQFKSKVLGLPETPEKLITECRKGTLFAQSAVAGFARHNWSAFECFCADRGVSPVLAIRELEVGDVA